MFHAIAANKRFVYILYINKLQLHLKSTTQFPETMPRHREADVPEKGDALKQA